MPCSDCGHTLAYHSGKQVLYCPDCLELPVADEAQIKRKATYIRDQYLNHPTLIQVLENFGSLRVIAGLLHKLNEGATGMTDENRMQFRKFLHPNFFIKHVYANADSFEDQFDPENTDIQDKIEERINSLLDADTVLIPILKQVQEEFVIVFEFTPDYGEWMNFYGSHDFEKSEYWLCSERCMRSTVGAREAIRDEFLAQQEIFRDFSQPDREDIETVREFADFWYGFIVSLGFVATLDDTTQDLFTTEFPEYVTIFDIEDLFSEVENAVAEQLQARGENDTRSLSLEEEAFDECGERVFGDNWDQVKDLILVSESNLDAHPLFFKVTGTKEMRMPNWRQSREVPLTRILYPDYFSLLLKFQIFPLLENGDADSSPVVLAQLTGERGLEFERNVYEYLKSKEIESYHSCKTSKQNGNEVDIIFAYEGTIYFVEVKFVLPTLNMQSQTGIRDVDRTFDEKIFREDKEGKSFPEKVDAWLSLDPDADITHQQGQDRTERVEESLQQDWDMFETEMLVISNFVPSYLTKDGVRFLTDLEFYRWLENGDDVFYGTLH